MDNGTRAALFWGVCIPVRVAVTAAAQQRNSPLRLAALAVAATWLGGSLDTKHRGFFGGEIWWRDQRTAHGLLWLAYGLTDQWEFLAADTAFGAANWVYSKAGVPR